MLLGCFETNWLIRVHQIALEGITGLGAALPVFIFIMTKMVQIEGKPPVKVHSPSSLPSSFLSPSHHLSLIFPSLLPSLPRSSLPHTIPPSLPPLSLKPFLPPSHPPSFTPTLFPLPLSHPPSLTSSLTHTLPPSLSSMSTSQRMEIVRGLSQWT